MNLKKVLKWIAGTVVFLTLPTLLLYGGLYLKYNEEIPFGVQGAKADSLATKMMRSIDYEAFKKTKFIEWTFKKRHHFKWEKNENVCTVYWKEFKVDLDLDDYSKSKAFIHNFRVEGRQAQGLINKAISYFNNDSFWLVAPFKVFDVGTERRLVTLDSGEEALLVTYTSGGSTPGDSYLWLLDDSYRPKSFKMWTSILPIQGLEASWEDWITTESGAQLPTFHKFLFFGIEINDVKTTL
jgi:hypothetical protein